MTDAKKLLYSSMKYCQFLKSTPCLMKPNILLISQNAVWAVISFRKTKYQAAACILSYVATLLILLKLHDFLVGALEIHICYYFKWLQAFSRIREKTRNIKIVRQEHLKGSGYRYLYRCFDHEFEKIWFPIDRVPYRHL